MNGTIPNGSVNIANSTINSIANHRASRTCLDIGYCTTTDNPTACDAVLAYPWLDQIIDSNVCTEIIDYQSGIHHYIYVIADGQGALYFNGDYYGNPPNPGEYGDEVARWECGCGNGRHAGSSSLPSADHLFDLYPNPTKGQILIELNIDNVQDSYTTLTVFDLAGKILYESHLSNQSKAIGLSSFSKGMYMVRLKNDQHQDTQKLIIE